MTFNDSVDQGVSEILEFVEFMGKLIWAEKAIIANDNHLELNDFLSQLSWPVYMQKSRSKISLLIAKLKTNGERDGHDWSFAFSANAIGDES